MKQFFSRSLFLIKSPVAGFLQAFKPRQKLMKSGGGSSFLLIVGMLLLMLLAACFWPQQSANTDSIKAKNSSYLNTYSKLLEQFNSDFKFARSAQFSDDSGSSIIVTTLANEKISYSILEGSLLRSDTQGETKTLMNIKSGRFFQNASLPSLISVILISSNSEVMPFFTSFAMRGYKP